MKLKIKNIEQELDFNNNNSFSLVVENPDVFFSVVNGFFEKSKDESYDGCFLYENAKDLDFAKNVEIINDFYNLSCNSKKIVSLIQKKILQVEQTEDFVSDIENLNNLLDKLLLKINDIIDVPIEIGKHMEYGDFVKFSGVNIVESESGFDRLVDYLNVVGKIGTARLILFVNAGTCFATEQLNRLTHQCEYYGLKLLFVDACDYNIKCDHKIIIDKDLCEI